MLDATDIEGVYANIELLGQVGGREEEAAALVEDLRSRVANVEQAVARAERVRTFYEIDPTLYTAGPGSFIDDVIRRAGGTNIAGDAKTEYPQLSSEQVVAADPQVIILGDEGAGVSPKAVKERAGWSKIAAVQEDRIYKIDPDIGSRPGPRIVDALEQVARFLHPDLFP